MRSRRLEGSKKRQPEEQREEQEPQPSRAHLTFRQGMDETQINRELLTKLMSLSEIIQSLSEENEVTVA